MTAERARALLTAVSRERGTGHVYTDAEAAALLALARVLARPPAAAPAAPPAPLRLVVLGRAA